MELLQLRYFCTTAEMLNISHAAAYYAIPQPAMSKTISRLEKELDVPLFSREKNHLRLTPEGQAFYRHLSAALKEIDGAVAEAGDARKKSATHFRLLVTALQSRTAEFLAAFRRSHPDVTFEVFKSGSFAPGEPPYALCISGMSPPAVYDCTIPLMTRSMELYAAVSESDPLAKKDRIRIADMRELPIITISPSPITAAFYGLCRTHGFEPNVVITCDDLQCRQRYIRSGAGVALTNSYSMADVAGDGVVVIPIDEKYEQTVSVYWSSRFSAGDLWRQLLQALLQFYETAQLRDNPTGAEGFVQCSEIAGGDK